MQLTSYRPWIALVAIALMTLTAACDKDAAKPDKAPSAGPASGPAAAPASGPAGATATPTAGGGDAAKADTAGGGGDQPDIKAWDTLLSTYITDDGMVKYKDLKANADHMKALNDYVAAIGAADVAKMDKDTQLAFYINAYNAHTLKAVLDRYPIESVMKVDGFFKGIKHKVAGEEMTLDTLENVKIRGQFKEPRIHFVVNCASASCPKLRRDAVTKANMDALMTDSAKKYIAEQTEVEGKTITTSQIFEWFADDFKATDGTVKAFLVKYSDGDLKKQLEGGETIKFSTYGWDLNEAK